MRAVNTLPGIAADEVHLVEVNFTSILLAGAITIAHIDGVVLDVLLDHIPWTTTKSQPLALPYGVEPVSVVLTQFAASLDFDDWTTLDAQVAANEVVVVDLSQEANSLAVFAVGVGEFHFLCNLSHTSLGHGANGKDEVLQLFIGYLREEVGLVLYRVDSRGEIFGAVDFTGGGIVSCCSEIKIFAPSLLEIPELNHAVAHHVGVGSESCLDSAQSILHDVVPVFLVQRYHLQWQSISVSDEVAHLDVFLGAAVALVVVHANANVEQLQVVLGLFYKLMHNYCAVDSA